MKSNEDNKKSKPEWKLMDDAPATLDNQDLLGIFNVKLRTLQRWRDTGILPFSKIGGKIYYDRDTLAQKMGDNDPLVKKKAN